MNGMAIRRRGLVRLAIELSRQQTERCNYRE
jgi:hypothetical protein